MSMDRVIDTYQLRQGGERPDKAKAIVLLIHGRGATADSMLPLRDMIGLDGLCYVAPQAEGYTWYPQSFMAPIEANEPYVSTALNHMAAIIADIADAGVVPEKLAIVGFSQGACLASETVLRNPRPYGFVGVLSGGAIGPPGTPRNYAGSLAGARVFLGCSDHDPHIPLTRVKETTALFKTLGATVSERIYAGASHGINDDEVIHLREGLSAMLRR